MNTRGTHNRHWYQFSLLTLLIVVTVATLAFGGWVQYRRQQAQMNRDRVATVEDAVAAIEKMGGSVKSEYKERRRHTWLEIQFDDPGSADDPVGVLKVTEVSFLSILVDDVWVRLWPANDLEQMWQGGTDDVTDDDLERMKRLAHLKKLFINNTLVTDAGLEHLKGLTSLRYLDLRSTNVTVEGVKKLQQALPNCEILR